MLCKFCLGGGCLQATTFAAASGSLHAPSQRPMALRLNAEVRYKIDGDGAW